MLFVPLHRINVITFIAMTSNIVQIGNSRGVIIPSILLQQMKLSLKSPVSIEVADEQIIIKPAPRQGWAEAFKALSPEDLTEQFFPDVFEDEDLSWWQWKQEQK